MMVGKPPARWQRTIRLDRIFVTTFVVGFGTALGFLGWSNTHSLAGTAWLIARVEVIPFLTFCSMIGTLVHVHHVQPTIRWWKRGEWTKFRGQMEGTTVLRVPKGMNFFLHWIMVHTPHHVDMRIPMYNLELAAKAIEEHFPATVHDEKARFSDFRANAKICKLYDFETGTWLPYSAARSVTPLETTETPVV
jgi:omega-6 fatty acid desaturase (delta-12 desaturase)